MKNRFQAFVYIIRRAGDGCIKIGVARHPKRRMRQLQTGSNMELSLVATFPFKSRMQAFELEKELHKKFAMFRQEGEWFKAGLLNKMFNDVLMDKFMFSMMKEGIRRGDIRKDALIAGGQLVELPEFGYTYDKDMNHRRGELIKKKLTTKNKQKMGHLRVIELCKEHGIEHASVPDNELVNRLPAHAREQLPDIVKKHLRS